MERFVQIKKQINMEKSKIDMFIGLNAENFHTHDLMMIKEKLEKMEDEKFILIQATQFQKPTTIFLISFFLGIERFWLDDVLLGIIKLLTFYGFFIWWLVDLISAKDRTKKYNYKKFLTACSYNW